MTPLVKVYGHPRSGNNLLMAMLAEHYYQGIDLSLSGSTGHWSDRINRHPNPYGKLSAWHHFPVNRIALCKFPVYIYRDGRAVAHSLWKSPHFKNVELEGISLSAFLREPIDWFYSPGRRLYGNTKMTVIDHWRSHLKGWERFRGLMVRYEDLVINPSREMRRVAEEIGLPVLDEYNLPKSYVGYFPSKSGLLGWMNNFSDEDNEFFFSIVPRNFWGVFDYQKGVYYERSSDRIGNRGPFLGLACEPLQSGA